MSFSKNLTITVKNTDAQLNEPLYVYEKDRNLIVYFKIMDYKYKFDKNPTNVLASVDDIMEAYATIVDPNGYELTRQYGEVVDDEIKFIVTNDLVDELDELGTYRLQFHIKCQHSEFTIPEISFKVLERLKGFRTVTDEGEVGDEILNNSESFIDAEGKLHLVWQEGDTISSIRLNQMVQVINNAVDEEHQRQINEVNRENRANAKLDELETRFSALTTSQQQSAEVIDARDGEASLKARLDRDVKKPLEYYGDVEGSYISTDSTAGYLKDVEILGNTIQNEDNLEDIRSVGNKIEGQELYEIPVLSCGKNLAKDISDAKINVNDTHWIVIDNGDGSYKVTGDGSGINGFALKLNVEVTPNTTYTFSFKVDGVYPTLRLPIYVYKGFNTLWDNNKVFYIGSEYTFTTPSDTNKICLGFYYRNTMDTTSVMISDIQLEEGTVETPYEPYQKDKLTILSPVQLEKVGDVADRVICKDGVFGVEKLYQYNWDDISFTIPIGQFDSDDFTGKYNVFRLMKSQYNLIKKGIYPFFRVGGSFDENFKPYDGECIWGDGSYLYFKILKGKTTLDEFKAGKSFDFIVQSENPQFIPLPHSQQVKLRTFANKTNISFLTEIEGTIKAQVPKSLGATVNTHTEQISNLNKELDRVKKLEESTVSTVETESDFTTVEATSNGYFEDVKLEGKTLVNLSTLRDKTLSNTNDSERRLDFNVSMFKANTDYTLIMNVGNVANGTRSLFVQWDFIDGSASKFNTINSNVSSLANSMVVFKFRQDILPSELKRVYLSLHINDSTSCICEIKDCIVLEDDHTQNPPSYFEGLKSVGEDVDEIVVSSVKGDGNLFDGRLDAVTILTDGNSLGKLVEHDSVKSEYTSHIKPIPIQPNTTYEIGIDNSDLQALCMLYDNNMNPLCFEYSNNGIKQFTTPNNAKYARVRYQIKYSDINNYNMYLVKIGDTSKDYMLHQSDKKRLLFYNEETQTWEKPILREWDSTEKHADGKYYYHQRSGEVVLNGSENNWNIRTDREGENTQLFTHAINGDFRTSNNDENLISDKFMASIRAFIDDKELFYRNNGSIYVRILKSKLPTQDVAGFKAWLQANNVTVVYQLAEEKIYECTNIDLITYEGETNYIIEAGAIIPKSILKVHSNIANVIRALQEKVSVLESNYVTLFNTITAAFNSLE